MVFLFTIKTTLNLYKGFHFISRTKEEIYFLKNRSLSTLLESELKPVDFDPVSLCVAKVNTLVFYINNPLHLSITVKPS